MAMNTRNEKAYYRREAMKKKVQEAKWKFRNNVEEFIRWCYEHREELAATGLLLTVVMYILKIVKSMQPTQAQKDEKWRAHHYYDKHSGWVATKDTIDEDTRRWLNLNNNGENLNELLQMAGIRVKK